MRNPSILKITAFAEKVKKSDWADNDIVMLCACFQLLVNCVEDEKLLHEDTQDWHCSEEVMARRVEIRTLYDWWKIREKQVEDFNNAEKYAEDDAMLIRLIKIRKHLWT